MLWNWSNGGREIKRGCENREDDMKSHILTKSLKAPLVNCWHLNSTFKLQVCRSITKMVNLLTSCFSFFKRLDEYLIHSKTKGTFQTVDDGNRFTGEEEVELLLLSQKASFIAKFRRRCFSTQVTGFGSKSTTDAWHMYAWPERSLKTGRSAAALVALRESK